MMLRGSGDPKYLGRMKKWNRWGRMIRFTIRERVLECEYSMDEQERKCRVCGYEKEDWRYVVHDWEYMRGMDERVIRNLDESGQGERWMYELKKMREERM